MYGCRCSISYFALGGLTVTSLCGPARMFTLSTFTCILVISSGLNLLRRLSCFLNSILSELISRWFFCPLPVSTLILSSELDVTTTSDKEEWYCYCEGTESDDMLACDNPSCPYRWFHFDCLKLTAPPRSKKWFRPTCRKLPHKKKKKLK